MSDEYRKQCTPDVLDKIQCTREAALHDSEGLLALGRVTPQGQNILDAIAFHLPHK